MTAKPKPNLKAICFSIPIALDKLCIIYCFIRHNDNYEK